MLYVKIIHYCCIPIWAGFILCVLTSLHRAIIILVQFRILLRAQVIFLWLWLTSKQSLEFSLKLVIFSRTMLRNNHFPNGVVWTVDTWNILKALILWSSEVIYQKLQSPMTILWGRSKINPALTIGKLV